MIIQGYNATALIQNLRTILSHKYGARYSITSYERNQHALLTSNSSKFPTLYVIYKRDSFMSFQNAFSDFCDKNPEYKNIGESINKSVLERTISRNIDYIIFIVGLNAYYIPSRLILNFCKKNNLIRQQKRLNSYFKGNNCEFVNETTYSFPKKLLKPIEELFE